MAEFVGRAQPNATHQGARWVQCAPSRYGGAFFNLVETTALGWGILSTPVADHPYAPHDFQVLQAKKRVMR